MKTKNLKLMICLIIMLVGFLYICMTDISGSTDPIRTEELLFTTTMQQLSFVPGREEGTGTYLALTNSYYLNVAVATDAVVKLSLESVPETVTLHISPSLETETAKFTLMGFDAETTYYMYVDDYHNASSFTTDQNGSFSFYQDLTVAHTIFIQPRPSTKFVPSDTDIGVWDSQNRIFTLTADVGETIQIDEDNLTLDGNGHSIIGYGTGHGVYMSGRTSVTVTNLFISDFTNGVFLNNCSQNLIIDNELSGNSAGVYVDEGSLNTIESNYIDGNTYGVSLYLTDLNEVLDNTISNHSSFGVYLYDHSDENLISGNSISANSQIGVEVYFECNYNEISFNSISGNQSGIDVYDSANNTIESNTISGNTSYGMVLSYGSTDNLIVTNNCSDNGFGLYIGGSSNSNQIYNNNFLNNTVQVQVFNGTANGFNLEDPVGGNYFSDWTTPDNNSDGFVDSPYAIVAEEWDYLPLAEPVGGGGAAGVDLAVSNLEEAIDYIGGLNTQALLRKSSGNLLISKINGGLELVYLGDYAGAASYINKNVLSKVDGCQKGGEPDRTDLIISCPEQEYVYSLVSEAIDILEAEAS